jgi:hypothetical protein
MFAVVVDESLDERAVAAVLPAQDLLRRCRGGWRHGRRCGRGQVSRPMVMSSITASTQSRSARSTARAYSASITNRQGALPPLNTSSRRCWPSAMSPASRSARSVKAYGVRCGRARHAPLVAARPSRRGPSPHGVVQRSSIDRHTPPGEYSSKLIRVRRPAWSPPGCSTGRGRAPRRIPL